MAKRHDSTDSSPGSVARPGGDLRAGAVVLGLGAFACWTYLGVVFLYQESLAGIWIGIAALGLLLIGGAIVAALLARAIARRLGSDTALNLGMAMIVSFIVLFAADSMYAVWSNAASSFAAAAMSDDVRLADENVWQGELMPRSWYPGPRNFHVYKPDVTLTARTYGEFYVPAMLGSPLLVDSVLEPRNLTYAIGRHGLREREPLTGTRLFALGDSFVFGYATDEGGVWTDLLGLELGESVYNMGVSGTSPRSQLMLLEHMLETQSDSMRIGRLLWMIFEGNDLEDDYAVSWQPPAAEGSSILDGTVVQALGSLPGRLKNQSIIRRALDGELVVTARSAVPGLDERRVFDGITLAAPLYRSAQWGYRLFAASDVRQVTTPMEYLLEHPNRPRLDETFEAMQRLAETHGFEVLVIVAPSASRMYGDDFEGFPELSAEPYFANYVLDLARAQGFASLDLLERLKPFARAELLYFRDDHHWNERGNEIAAQLIAEAITRLDGPRQGPPSR